MRRHQLNPVYICDVLDLQQQISFCCVFFLNTCRENTLWMQVILHITEYLSASKTIGTSSLLDSTIRASQNWLQYIYIKQNFYLFVFENCWSCSCTYCAEFPYRISLMHMMHISLSFLIIYFDMHQWNKVCLIYTDLLTHGSGLVIINSSLVTTMSITSVDSGGLWAPFLTWALKFQSKET